MKLEEQILELERQQHAELRNAEVLFARTKRDIRRKLSPDRLIRKNVGLTMAAAAIGAMLLARGFGRPRKEKGDQTETKAKGASGLLGFFGGMLPRGMGHLIGPNASEEKPTDGESTSRKHEKSLMEVALAELLTLAARRVNWAGLLQRMTGSGANGHGAATSEKEPTMGVADAGTMRSDKGIGDFTEDAAK